jgi:hypothetical protein
MEVLTGIDVLTGAEFAYHNRAIEQIIAVSGEAILGVAALMGTRYSSPTSGDLPMRQPTWLTRPESAAR